MSKQRLYRVKFTTTVYAVSFDPETAVAVAEDALHREQPEFDYVDVGVARVVPSEWARALPFGDNQDRTCNWWVKR